MSTWFRTYGFAELSDGLLIGCYPLDPEDAAMLQWTGVDRVLNLVEDGEYRPGEREALERAFAELGIEEQRLPLPDFGGMPRGLIDRAVATIADWLNEGHHVYVHCRAGWQRSPAIATAVLAARDDLDIDEALEFVRAQKPSADPLPHQRDDLWRWWQDRVSQPRATGAP